MNTDSAAITILLIIVGFGGFLLGRLSKKKEDDELTVTPKVCRNCHRETKPGSDYCSDHWYYESQEK